MYNVGERKRGAMRLVWDDLYAFLLTLLEPLSRFGDTLLDI